ncbi:hypothetical protein HBI28_170700 [Parastagonospora nodorum]|nr:hypothetical protein HBI28_170700 [Parastagonospora nodorum]
MVKNIRNQQVRGGVALPPVKRARPRYAGSNKGTPAPSRTTFLLLSHPADLFHQIELVQPEHESTLNKARECIRTADARRMVRGLENSASASPLVYSDYALQECSLLNVRHVQRPADACDKTGTHRGYSCICPELSRTASPQTENPASPRFLNSAIAAIIARAANMMALMGTVLYNAIKEYYDDRTRKTIYFYGYTVEDNYNAISIYANYIENSGSNVIVPDDYHDNDVDNILMKCTDDERQRYNILIEDYNCAGKREDNILTVDECRTGHSNEEDIEADEREEETRVRLRELSGEIHDILLREFRRADDFTESVTHNDDEQDEFAILAEEYTIDNRIVHALLEDCDALVERYEEEINCSDLYSTV